MKTVTKTLLPPFNNIGIVTNGKACAKMVETNRGYGMEINVEKK